MIALSKRFQAIARHIEKGWTIADIGCDHGLLGVGMLQRGIASRVIAVDRSGLSLKKTERLAARLQLEDRLDCRLGDGLEPLLSDEVQAVVVAGVSGMEIGRILERGAQRIGPDTRLILQPMQGQDVLRKALIAQGLSIQGEDLVADNRRLFDVIIAGRQDAPPYDLRYAEVGFLLFEQRHPLLKERVAHKLKIKKKVLGNLEKNGRGTKKKLDALKESVRFYEEMIKCL